METNYHLALSAAIELWEGHRTPTFGKLYKKYH